MKGLIKKIQNVSFTKGDAMSSILVFAIPIFLGNVLSSAFGWADGYLVSSKIGTEALAALPIAGSGISVFLIFASAFPVGMSSLFAKIFGEGDSEKLRKNYLSSLILVIIVGLILTGLSLALMKPILLFMKARPGTEIYAFSEKYYFIASFSFLGMGLYSFLISYLRALGDSKVPLLFILVYSSISILLDYLFIGVASIGIVGSALSSVVSYAVVVVFGFVWLFVKHPELRIKRKDFSFGRQEIKEELVLSLPLAFQLALISIGGVATQSGIDAYGTDAILGLSVAGKVTGVLGLYINGINNAIGPFVSQNIGAKQCKRAKDGLSKSLIICGVLCLVDILLMFVLIKPTTSLFLPEANETVYRYAYLSLFFSIGSYLLLPLIGNFRYVLESVGHPLINLYAGFAQLAGQLLTVFALSLALKEYAIVGAGFISQIIPAVILLVGVFRFVYRDPRFSTNIIPTNDDKNVKGE